MDKKNNRVVSVHYIVLLILYFITAFYITRTSRSDGVIMIMGMISRHDLSTLPGIFIKNTTYISDDKEVYAALTGDQVALTDIRVIS